MTTSSMPRSRTESPSRGPRPLLRVAALALALASAGCISERPIQTIVVEADGSVTWTVVEMEARSLGDSAEGMRSEDAEFLERAASGDGDMARALRALGPTDVESTVLRDRRPFLVVTEATFPSVEALAQALVGEAGTVTVERGPDRVAVTATVRSSDVDRGEEGDDTPLEILGRKCEDIAIVLADGAFEEGTTAGFDAELDLAQVDRAEVSTDGLVTLRLEWRTGMEVLARDVKHAK